MENTEESKEVIIRLSESRNAKVLNKNSLIHKREFDKAFGWINDRIDDAAKKKNNDKKLTKEEIINVRLHDTMTILGSRGSGKTTFIYSILSHYKKRNDVVVINIDPTLIEEKGHIFLTILSQITKVIEKELSKSDCDPESESYQKKKIWEKKLLNLAAGIPSIDGVGSGYENWQDPEFIMHKGLRSVDAAVRLESDFNELLVFGLEILDKDIYLIALDDIDIDFQKGWPVLEAVRKYLTSPYIITLLSGDLKLFSKAIRKQQWKNFGKALLKNEGEALSRISDYDDLVTEMEGQYLQKVMQPQRRIHLTTIQEKINTYGKDNLEIYIENKDKTNVKIDEYYDGVLEKFGIKNKYQKEPYRSFLLGLPIRTQIQFLSEFENTLSIKEINTINAFLSDLYEKRVDIDTAKANIKYIDIVILKLLLRERALEEAYQLQPTTTDISLNSSLTALSFLFSQKNTDFQYLIFDYFIRIGYVRNLLSVLPYQSKDMSSLSPSIDGLCKHSSIYFDRVYRDILGSMTAYLRAFLNIEKENISPWGGTIPIYAPSESAKGKGNMSIRIDNVFKDAPLYKKQIAFMPVSISQPNDKQSSFTTYSIYLLLATIGEIIKQYKENADLNKTFGELSQIRSYSMPTFKYNSVPDEKDREGVKAMLANKNDNDTYFLVNEFIKWVDTYPKDYIISPHALGKMSTRLFYALRNLENSESIDNLGEAMHSRIIILLNTILLEEAREYTDNNTLSNNNPKDSKIFKDNILKCTKEDFANLKLFTWIFSCPILLPFLNNDDANVIEVRKQIHIPNENIWAESIYSELKQVKTLSNRSSQQKNIGNTKKNKNSKREIKRIKLNSLYYSEKRINESIKHIEDNSDLISIDEFMNEDIDFIIPKLRKLFTKNVNEKAISAIRNYMANK